MFFHYLSIQVAREERTKAAFSTGADTGVLWNDPLHLNTLSLVLHLSGTSLPTATALPLDKPFVYTEPSMELQGPVVPKTHQLEEVCSISSLMGLST